jgi:putative inorganic carbon (HCO3(-)) transporter
MAMLAVLLGLIAGWQPAVAVAGAVAMAFVALMLSELAVGLALFTVMMFFPVLGGGVSPAKLAGLLLALSWVVTWALRRASDRERPSLLANRPVFAGALTLFVAWAAFSVLWAKRPDLSRGALFTLILNLALFPIVFAAVREPRHVRWLSAAFVAGTVLTAIVGLLIPDTPEPGEEGRLAGKGVASNQLGGYLMVAAILAATLASSRQLSARGRAASAGAAALCLVLQLMTGSRGAMLGLAVALIAAPFVVGRGRRAGVATLAVLTVLSGVAFFVTIAPDAVVQRITRSDTTGSGRKDIWRIGWRMVEAHPVTGVGTGNFSVSTIDYLLRPGATDRDVYIVDDPKVAHNIYLDVLAELGLPGLALFGLIVATSLQATSSAARLFAGRAQPATELLARGLLIALIGMLVAAFFSSEFFSKQLWLLLAVAVALRSLADPRRHDRHRSRTA